MDKLTKYRHYIQELLTEYARDDRLEEGVETQLIFDTQRDHYQWSNVGWNGLHRVYHCIMQFDIKEGKIWLQQNLTDQNPAEELVKKGVPRTDIILGLQAPYKRIYTDYGVA